MAWLCTCLLRLRPDPLSLLSLNAKFSFEYSLSISRIPSHRNQGGNVTEKGVESHWEGWGWSGFTQSLSAEYHV